MSRNQSQKSQTHNSMTEHEHLASCAPEFDSLTSGSELEEQSETSEIESSFSDSEGDISSIEDEDEIVSINNEEDDDYENSSPINLLIKMKNHIRRVLIFLTIR